MSVICHLSSVICHLSSVYVSTQLCCVQVDWADPDIEGYVTELMNNRNVCVRNLPRSVQDFQIRDFFNSLSSGQVENILRTSGYVLVTFLSPGKTMIFLQ